MAALAIPGFGMRVQAETLGPPVREAAMTPESRRPSTRAAGLERSATPEECLFPACARFPIGLFVFLPVEK